MPIAQSGRFLRLRYYTVTGCYIVDNSLFGQALTKKDFIITKVLLCKVGNIVKYKSTLSNSGNTKLNADLFAGDRLCRERKLFIEGIPDAGMDFAGDKKRIDLLKILSLEDSSASGQCSVA